MTSLGTSTKEDPIKWDQYRRSKFLTTLECQKREWVDVAEARKSREKIQQIADERTCTLCGGRVVQKTT